MYNNYLAPLLLLFLSIIVFRFVFKKISTRSLEGFEEKSIPAPNDNGVKLLYEIRGMMLNNQNDIDKKIRMLSESKDSSVVLDKMSELETLLKGKTTMNIDPSDTKEPEAEPEAEPEEAEPEAETESETDANEERSKKGKSKVGKKKNMATQPVDESSDDDESGDVVESFVEGMEYYNSATNCYQV